MGMTSKRKTSIMTVDPLYVILGGIFLTIIGVAIGSMTKTSKKCITLGDVEEEALESIRNIFWDNSLGMDQFLRQVEDIRDDAFEQKKRIERALISKSKQVKK